VHLALQDRTREARYRNREQRGRRQPRTYCQQADCCNTCARAWRCQDHQPATILEERGILERSVGCCCSTSFAALSLRGRSSLG
jgi:hypothetical protein